MKKTVGENTYIVLVQSHAIMIILTYSTMIGGQLESMDSASLNSDHKKRKVRFQPQKLCSIDKYSNEDL